MANEFFSSTAVDAALAGVIAEGAFISLHTATPGTTGASEVTGGSYARVQTTFAAPAGSSSTGSAVTINVPAGTTIAFFGVWTLESGGVFLEGGPLSSSETFTGAGTYTLTPTLTGQG